MASLLFNGNVVKKKWMSSIDKNKIDNLSGIDFLISYIKDRVYINNKTSPKIKIKGIGDKVLILRSGTGSGKSTLLPPGLYNTFFEKKKKNIICTQPTVATAIDIPYQILFWNKNLSLGENIGFQTGGLTWKPIKGILFATVGILLQQLRMDTDEDFMKKYSFIIIDEAHTRSLEMDSTLFYLKQLLQRNWDKPECPMVILMSATIDPNVFMKYFKCPKENFLDVLGISYPIEDNYLKFDLSDYITYTIDLIEKIHVENTDDFNSTFRDILVFAQGAYQIKEISKKIHVLNAKIFSKGITEAKIHSKEQWKKYGGSDDPIYYIAPVLAMSANIQAGGKEYRNLFSDIESVTVDIYNISKNGEPTDIIKTVPASRRVIIGTNAIETGITIDTLKYCIDTGWVKQASFDPIFGCLVLTDKSITQANSQQRRGRVGRKAPGIFYAEYTEDVKNSMQPFPYPDIIKNDITDFILGLIISETETELLPILSKDKTEKSILVNKFNQNWFDFEIKSDFIASSLDFIQYPSANSISYSLEKLHKLGFIDWEYKPTLFGYFANKFRKVSIENIRMILAGYSEGANILDLITIACATQIGFKLGINKYKYKPRNPLNVSEEEAYYYYKILFMDEFIEYLFIWNDFMDAIKLLGDQIKKQNNISISYLTTWASKNHFKLDSLFQLINNRDEVIQDMIKMGLNPFYNGLGLPRGTYNLVNILNRNLSEGLLEVQKIKKCIYEGYRMNLLVYNNISKQYVSQRSHMFVNVISKLVKPLFKVHDAIEQTVPYFIVVSNIILRSSFTRPGAYEFFGGDVSVMDGYVDLT